MSPFEEEVNKVANAADAVTSKWKTWGMAFLFIVAATVLIFAVIRFLK